MKQLEVQIMGQHYMLACPEDSEERLFEAVTTVDGAMCKIRDAGKVKARDRIAVLASLNLAYQLLTPAPQTAVAEPVGGLPPDDDEPDAQLQALLQRLDAVLALDTSAD